MNLQALLERYRADNRLDQLADRLSMSAPQQIALEGLTGSAAAFIAAALWKPHSLNHVFVLNDREEAAYFHNDLENLLNILDICYFPDSFKKPGYFQEQNSSH